MYLLPLEYFLQRASVSDGGEEDGGEEDGGTLSDSGGAEGGVGSEVCIWFLSVS